MTSGHLFESVVEALEIRADVTKGRMFGSPVLKVGGKVFSMLVKGKLVVKLPLERVNVIVASHQGEYFDPGHGRPSKQWVTIKPGDDWLSLSEEAREFVASSR